MLFGACAYEQARAERRNISMKMKNTSDVFVLEYLADSELDTNDVVGCAGNDINIDPLASEADEPGGSMVA